VICGVVIEYILYKRAIFGRVAKLRQGLSFATGHVFKIVNFSKCFRTNKKNGLIQPLLALSQHLSLSELDPQGRSAPT